MSASESSTIQPNTPVPTGQQQPTKVPLLGEGFQESAGQAVSKSAESSDIDSDTKDGTKSGKRRLFGFGKKKKDDDKSKSKKKEGNIADDPNGSDTPIAQPTQNSPIRSSNYPYQLPSSPQRNLYSSSPRIVSPAGSQIFERDVQESSLPVPNSPAIPSHIQQENHIPAVLDASSEAITNKSLDPDSVEIVMHSSHQPAAVSVTGIASTESHGHPWSEDLLAHTDKDDAASNYGALDSADGEHMEHAGSRDSLYVAGLSSFSSGGHRSPSPVRSPVSSGTSPPTSKSASIKGVELSPRAKALGSPVLAHLPSAGGELTIETMSQALRSPLISPSSPDGLSDRSFR